MSLCDRCVLDDGKCSQQWHGAGCEFFESGVSVNIHPESYESVEAEDETINPSHYKAGKIETHEKIEAVLKALQEHSDYGSAPISFIKCADLFNALKYFDRMGLKDGEPFEKDAVKCANYFHKIFTGEWFKE